MTPGVAKLSISAAVLVSLALSGCHDATCRRPAPVVDYPTPTAPIKAAMVGVRTCLQKQVAHLVAAKDPAGEIAADALLGCQGAVDDLNAAQRAAGAADDVKSASGFTITETTYTRDDFRPRVQHLVADALGEHCWWPPKPAAKARVVEVLP